MVQPAPEVLERVSRQKAAVVTIDIQNDFCHEKGSLPSGGKADISFIQTMVENVLVFLDEAGGTASRLFTFALSTARGLMPRLGVGGIQR